MLDAALLSHESAPLPRVGETAGSQTHAPSRQVAWKNASSRQAPRQMAVERTSNGAADQSKRGRTNTVVRKRTTLYGTHVEATKGTRSSQPPSRGVVSISGSG